MKIRLSQLRSIIKEEVQLALHEAAPRKKSDPEWVALKAFLGPKEYRRLYTGPESLVHDASHGWGDSKLESKLRAIFSDKVVPAFHELVDSFPEGETSQNFKSSLSKMNSVIKEFDKAYASWRSTSRAPHHTGRLAPVPQSPQEPSYIKSTPPMSEKERYNWEMSGAPPLGDYRSDPGGYYRDDRSK